MQNAVFVGYVVILALLLFFPVSRLIWVTSVRRLQRKLSRQLDDQERAGQHRRARILTLVVVIPFSLLFNISTIGIPSAG